MLVQDYYADLFKQASSYAQRKIATEVSSVQAEKDAKLRMYLFAGLAGVATLVLVGLVARR